MTPADLMKQYMDDTSDEAVEWIKYAGWLESRCCDLTKDKEGMEKIERIGNLDIEQRDDKVKIRIYPKQGEWKNDAEYWGLAKKYSAPSLLACIELLPKEEEL